MKIPVLIVIAIACFTGESIAQEPVHTSSNDNAARVSARSARKPLTAAGRVSADGRTFFTDIDSEWIVSNPDALKGREGRYVMVKCYVDTEKNQIEILRVNREKQEESSKYAAGYGDSAFRR